MNSPLVGLIGGTGFTTLDTLQITHRQAVSTPYGEPSSTLNYVRLDDRTVVFLARHGQAHHLPPHKINYRANIWALHHIGVKQVIAVAAVGGIRDDMEPGVLALPDQIIDYTWGRHSSFFEDDLNHVIHIDFTEPYDAQLRQQIIRAADALGLSLDTRKSCTYGATQGPRLETTAEIRRMAQDGCDIVGMTGMPEAALAREMGLRYATCAVVANWAAGKTDGEISMDEIRQNLEQGMVQVKRLLHQVISTMELPELPES